MQPVLDACMQWNDDYEVESFGALAAMLAVSLLLYC